jgi:5-methylcytosine-specific restriction endonuclease McrA
MVPPMIIEMRKPGRKRRPLSKRDQEDILGRQKNRCFYCSLPFGEFFIHKNKLKCVAVGWDHILPYSYCFNDDKENRVAACFTCNLIKGSRVFDTVQQAIDYVREQRAKKGMPVSELPKGI